jgi:hypothetical protein
MRPEQAPGEHDIFVRNPTIVDVVEDCEQGVGVAAQISTIWTLYSVNGTMVV